MEQIYEMQRWSAKNRKWRRDPRGGEFSAGSLHLVPDIHGYSTFTERSKPLVRDPLTSTQFKGAVDISPPRGRFLYGPYRGNYGGVRLLYFGWRYIVARWRRARMGSDSAVGHQEGNIEFCGQVFGLGIYNSVQAKGDNQVTWGQAVMVAALVARVEMDFARMLIHPTGALDIGLIRDEANIAAPRREPRGLRYLALDTDLMNTVMGRHARSKLEARMATFATSIRYVDAKVVAESRG
ncbi:hypothetical protein H5410_000842 [Solanum commersonii]|uniref:Uncharacterized protein n=1 Tax=Solanum commersonii TaxID=4109 RepID=A0A9J6AWZ7_SOLCO|nr:hypothetical protein H5410_000842 [Solanum commersonii]